MKVNWNTVLTDLEDKPIKDGDKDLTLGVITCTVLLAVMQGDDKLSGTEKLSLFKLAQKVTSDKETDVSAEEITLLKERIGKAYGALIVGRAFSILEGQT